MLNEVRNSDRYFSPEPVSRMLILLISIPTRRPKIFFLGVCAHAVEIAAVIASKQRKSFFIRSKLGLVFYTEDKKISVIKKGFSLIK